MIIFGKYKIYIDPANPQKIRDNRTFNIDVLMVIFLIFNTNIKFNSFTNLT